MDHNSIHELDRFLEDIGFPIDKEGLLLEALDSPLPSHIKDAIALLPEGTYMTREEVRRELVGASEDEGDKKIIVDEEDEDVEIDHEGTEGGGVEILEVIDDEDEPEPGKEA